MGHDFCKDRRMRRLTSYPTNFSFSFFCFVFLYLFSFSLFFSSPLASCRFLDYLAFQAGSFIPFLFILPPLIIHVALISFLIYVCRSGKRSEHKLCILFLFFYFCIFLYFYIFYSVFRKGSMARWGLLVGGGFFFLPKAKYLGISHR